MVPPLAMALPTMAISSTVACGPAGLSCVPTGSPAAAQAVSHSVISSGSGMSEVASGRSKSMLSLNPNCSAPSTRRSAPICTPSWPYTVLEDTSVARARLMVP